MLNLGVTANQLPEWVSSITSSGSECDTSLAALRMCGCFMSAILGCVECFLFVILINIFLTCNEKTASFHMSSGRLDFILLGDSSPSLLAGLPIAVVNLLVVRIPGFPCCGRGSIPGVGIEIPQATLCSPQKTVLLFL